MSAKNFANPTWTEDELKILTAAYFRGVRLAEIAAVLGRSRRAVEARCKIVRDAGALPPAFTPRQPAPASPSPARRSMPPMSAPSASDAAQRLVLSLMARGMTREQAADSARAHREAQARRRGA